MKKLIFGICLMLVMAVPAFAQDAAQADNPAAPAVNAVVAPAAEAAAPAAEVAAPVEVGNATDLVTGEAIDMTKAVKAEFEGKIYNFVSEENAAKFKEDAAKYVADFEAKAAEAAQAAESVTPPSSDSAVPAEAPAAPEAAPLEEVK